MHLIQFICKDARSKVRVGSGYNEELGVNVNIHLVTTVGKCLTKGL